MTTGPTFEAPAAGDEFSQVHHRPSPAVEQRQARKEAAAEAAYNAATTPAERAARMRELDDVRTSGSWIRKSGGMRR